MQGSAKRVQPCCCSTWLESAVGPTAERVDVRFILAAVSCLVTASLALSAVPPEPEVSDFMKTTEWLAQKYTGASQWEELDAMIEKLASSGERAVDGRFQLYLATSSIEHWLSLW